MELHWRRVSEVLIIDGAGKELVKFSLISTVPLPRTGEFISLDTGQYMVVKVVHVYTQSEKAFIRIYVTKVP